MPSFAKTLPIIAATAAGLVLAALVGGALVVYGGLYDVAATRQHWQFTHSTLETAMRQSVRVRARDIHAPALVDERMALRGAACFRDKCVQCHGAPGVAQSDIGQSMQPLPGPLVDARQHWRPRELYWVVRHGLKMTGMPAWEHHLTDGDLWDVVAFLQHLPELNAEAYDQWQQRADAQLVGAARCGKPALSAAHSPFPPGYSAEPALARRPDVQRGRQALHQHACTACHSIPGVTGTKAFVGPPLDGFARRTLIAGTLPTSQENLVQWLMHTQRVKPGTAMPELGVAPQDAHDMAAYLLSLH
ncbi:c-type cytochrome [Acidovorax sp. sic0104]|uniref:c-type cytochrome n=1 Tax=Acidovorax sp. sic0104 TaxID=2854784 RepID=UPI001C4822B3|nr:c-type cytochrome [Acidovorax sp. sic0104]MBV7542704.1 c-type cytochrome [Acidovorax sp. sic0104]